MRYKHYAIVNEKGKLELSNPDTFKQEVLKFAGKRVYVVVDEEKQNRSTPQNNYYWGVVVKMLADELGYIPNDMHKILADDHAPKKILKVAGKDKVIAKSTTEMKTDEFETYLESIRRFASLELNCKIPLPNEVEVGDE
uniref:Uncharacterized protein n=1 Tax=viral metagenome TaxID=1070528 RepID=A0A6M3M676_9ZZZZ